MGWGKGKGGKCTFDDMSHVRGVGEDFDGVFWWVALVHGARWRWCGVLIPGAGFYGGSYWIDAPLKRFCGCMNLMVANVENGQMLNLLRNEDTCV